jgi:folate-binding protein YgfZ
MALLLDDTAVALRDAGVVVVSGPDRLTYLHSLLSQDLEHAATGRVADFLYLDAKGNAIAEGRAVVVAGRVLLVVPRQVATALADALGRFTFLLDAPTEDRSAAWAVASARGPQPIEHQGARTDAMTVAPAGDGFIVRDRAGGVDLVGPREWVEQRIRDAGWPLASAQDWEAWRISAGIPAWGAEIIPGRRAQELGLLPTHVHLRKGCYPGQESIAKIFNLGTPRRALTVVEFAGTVNVGDPVAIDGKTGEITSAAPAGAAWIALAMLPLSADGTPPGDGTVTVGTVHGRIRKRVGEDLPLVGV